MKNPGQEEEGIVRDQERLLGVLSRGGNPREQSPCCFCKKQGTSDCPNGDVAQLGACASYDPIEASNEDVEAQILAYLATPNLLPMLH